MLVRLLSLYLFGPVAFLKFGWTEETTFGNSILKVRDYTYLIQML